MWTRWFQIVVYLCVFGSVKTIHDSDFDFWYYVWLCGCGWGSDEIGLWCDLCYSYWTMMETCGCPKKVQKYRHFFFSCFVLYRPVVDDRIMKCVEIMYCSFIYIYILFSSSSRLCVCQALATYGLRCLVSLTDFTAHVAVLFHFFFNFLRASATTLTQCLGDPSFSLDSALEQNRLLTVWGRPIFTAQATHFFFFF